MLRVEGVVAGYGESRVLEGIDLEVGAGELVALLGRNGAGKTTTVRAITGALPIRAGRVTIREQVTSGRPPEAIARLGVALVPQGRGVFPNLTVAENLALAPRLRNGPWRLDAVLDLFPQLRQRMGNRGNQLSGGEQQMVAIARALLMNPHVLVMDEPTEGLAPKLVADLRTIGQTLRRSGLSILLVEQHLPLALALADRVYILNRGAIVWHGAPDALRRDEDVKSAYLGA